MKNIYKSIFLVLFLLLPFFAHAQAVIAWGGWARDNNWHNPLNWQNGVVPSANDVAYFDMGSNTNPVININSNVIIYKLILGTGFTGAITQNAAKFYVGYGGVTIHDGSLVLANGSNKIWGDFTLNGGYFSNQSAYFSSAENSQTFTSAIKEFRQPCASGFPAENLNYVRQHNVLTPVQDATLVDNLPVGSQTVVTEYYDGLGRPMETVARQASPSQDDIVMVHEYDVNGLETKRFLPYVATSCSGTYINIFTALLQQQNFYDPAYNDDPLITKGKTNPYQEIVYDNTPFKRITEAATQGSAWQVIKDANAVSTQAGHTSVFFARTNIANEVLLWTYNHTNGSASAFTAGLPVFYPARTLYAKESIDENGLKTIQFTNNLGQLLLKRTVQAAGNMDTYYIYDHFGRLTYIIPPEAAQNTSLAAENYSITLSGSFTNRWLFSYTYDERHRLVTQKVPGAGISNFIYDPLDRQILSQSANQIAANQWLFEKYDVFGRSAVSGMYTDVRTRSAIQASINSAVTSSSLYYESRSSGTGNLGYYSNTVFPTGITSSDLLKLSYYNDYDFNFDNAHIADYSYSNAGISPEPVPYLYNFGKATGIQVRVVGTSNWITTVNFYDKFGRVIQARSNNHLYVGANPGSSSLNDATTLVYDFAGRVTSSRHVHTPGVAQVITINERFTYDHMGRPLQTWQKINTSPEVLVTSLKYNELGQPIEKNLHSENNGATFLQSIDFRYNIRGSLTGINNSSLSNDGGLTNNDGNDLFGMNFNYETANTDLASIPRFNGDITAARWKTNNVSNLNTQEQAYAYHYDGYGRLTDALSVIKETSGWKPSKRFKERGITYDLNGNIKTLNRGDKNGAAVDSLSYSYTGNQLIKIADNGSASALGFTSRSAAATQYTYDANGNLLTDANRQFNFTYNYLDLTLTAINTGTATPGTITYSYDAAGNKLSKTVTPPSGMAIVTHYVGNFIYVGNILQSIMTPEGRLMPAGTGFNYEYTITDQQGNARISFDKDPNTGQARVVQENHYYAFGLKRENSYTSGPANNYLYSGKELQQELNLNQYDYGFRQYDAVLGRWHCQDALADMYHDESPYQFVGNNPVNWVDIMGLSRGDGNSSGADGGGNGSDLHSHKSYWNGSYGYGDEVFLQNGVEVFRFIGEIDGPNQYWEGEYFNTASEEYSIINSRGEILPQMEHWTYTDVTAQYKGQQNNSVSSFMREAQYAIPVWGSVQRSTDSWNQGNYWDAGAHYAMAFFEAFTLGVGTEANLTVGAAESVSASVATNLVDDAVQYSDDLVRTAQQAYPNLAGKIQLHHPIPQYLGGAKSQLLVPLDAAYHQQITNAFRAEWGYGLGKPTSAQLETIMNKVYSQFPLPK